MSSNLDTYKVIDVVIVTYNSTFYISKLLKSLTYSKDYIDNILIIENSSTSMKEIKTIVEKFHKDHRDLQITFTTNENVGFARSSNKGAKTGNSNYILFLNPDVIVQRDAIKILLEHLQKSNADFIGGQTVDESNRVCGTAIRKPSLSTVLFDWTNLGKLLKYAIPHQKFYYEDIKILEATSDIRVDALSGAYLLAKRKSFEKLSGFDSEMFMYLEDVDLGVRAMELKMKMIYCPHSVITHYQGGSSTNEYRINEKAWYDSREYYCRKHFNILINVLLKVIFRTEEFLLKLI